MINSKKKGSTGELEASKFFTDCGLPARRSQQYCGTEGNADVTFLDKEIDSLLHIEVKRNEHLNIDQAMMQALDDCHVNGEGKGKYAVVVHRKNRDKTNWKATMCLADFIELFRAWFELSKR